MAKSSTNKTSSGTSKTSCASNVKATAHPSKSNTPYSAGSGWKNGKK